MKLPIYGFGSGRYHSVYNMQDSTEASPYDVIAEQYDQLFDEVNPYYAHIEKRERQLFDRWILPTRSRAPAMDIGCGTGLHTRWLAERGYAVCGVDSSARMIAVAKRKSFDLGAQVRFEHWDAASLGAQHRSGYDVIVCLGSTLNHLTNWPSFFKEAAACLRPGGRMIFNFDNVLGTDTLFWLLKPGKSIYPDQIKRRKLLGKLWAGLRGRAFHNHWYMDVDDTKVEVPLTYDTMKNVRSSTSNTGLRLVASAGVHLLTCVSGRVMEASAYVGGTATDSAELSCLTDLLCRTDLWVSAALPSLSSNVVAVVVRDQL